MTIVEEQDAGPTAVLASRPETAFDRPIGERVNEVKDALKEAFRRTR